MQEAFFDALPEPLRAAWEQPESRATIAAWLDGALEEARRAWGPLDEDAFARHLASRATFVDDVDALVRLHAVDLALASACLRGEPRAIESLEREVRPVVLRALQRTRLDGGDRDDVGAAIREELVFGRDGKPPLLATYSGRGSLKGWAHAIASRLGVKRQRDLDRHVVTDDLEPLVPVVTGPDVTLDRHRHRRLFDAAFTAAVRALETRERNLLRQHYLDGLGIDDLGAMYRVHRATAARWLIGARQAIFDRVKTLLAENLSPAEVNELLIDPDSDFALSLSRIFEEPRG